MERQKNELDAYFSLPGVPLKDDETIVDFWNKGGHLKWWKEKQEQFPAQVSIAKDYLAVPATSFPYERFFSDLIPPSRLY